MSEASKVEVVLQVFFNEQLITVLPVDLIADERSPLPSMPHVCPGSQRIDLRLCGDPSKLQQRQHLHEAIQLTIALDAPKASAPYGIRRTITIYDEDGNRVERIRPDFEL